MHAAARAGEPFELVVLDGQMPGMDGIELAQAISLAPVAARRAAGDADVDRPTAARRAREAGIDHYLKKPVRRARLLETVAEAMGAAPSAGAPSRAPARRRPARRGDAILVVEDNAVNQRVIEAMLAKRGYAVEVAGNGREALSMLAVRSYALVFMDCQMPEMDGYEATAAIRARETRRPTRLPIVAMTAHAMKGDRERCLAAGMDDYLSKPLRPEELDAVLERWLGAPGRRPRRDGAPAATGDPFDALVDDARMRVFRVDYPEIVDQLIELFVESTPPLLDELRAGAEQRRRRGRPPRRPQAQGLLPEHRRRLHGQARARPRARRPPPRRPQLDGARPRLRRTRATRCARRCWRATPDGRRPARPAPPWRSLAAAARAPRRGARARRPSAGCRTLAAQWPDTAIGAGRPRPALHAASRATRSAPQLDARPRSSARRARRRRSRPTASRRRAPHIEAALAGEPGSLEWVGVRSDAMFRIDVVPFRETAARSRTRCSRSATSATSAALQHSLEEQRGFLSAVLEQLGERVRVADADGRSVDFGGRHTAGTTTCTRSSGPSTSGCTHPDGAAASGRTRRRCCARCAATRCATSRCASTRPTAAARCWPAAGRSSTPDGRKLGAVVVNADLTAFRDAEGRLRRSEERHRRVVESMVDCVFETDEQGRWTHLSENWTAATGYSVEDSLGRPCVGVRAPRRPRRARARLRAAAGRRARRRCAIAHRFLTTAGAERWAEVQVRAISGWDGLPTGFVGVMRDVTDEQRARSSTPPPSRPSCALLSGADGLEDVGAGPDRVARLRARLGRRRAVADGRRRAPAPHRRLDRARRPARSLHGRRRARSATRSATASRARRGCRACRCGRPTSAATRLVRREDGHRRRHPLDRRAAAARRRACRSASSCSSRARRASPSPASCACWRRSAATSPSSCSAARPRAAPPSRPRTCKKLSASRTSSPAQTDHVRAPG